MAKIKLDKKWFEKRSGISYEDWRGNGNKYDFFMTDIDIAKNVSPEAMIMYSVIESGIVSSIPELADILNVSNSRVSNHLQKLEDAGYVISWKCDKLQNSNTISQEEVKEKLMNRKKETCEWCGCETLIIEEHHYPIPQRYGGTEVVRICKNCHIAFHQIEIEENGGW